MPCYLVSLTRSELKEPIIKKNELELELSAVHFTALGE